MTAKVYTAKAATILDLRDLLDNVIEVLGPDARWFISMDQAITINDNRGKHVYEIEPKI